LIEVLKTYIDIAVTSHAVVMSQPPGIRQ